MTVNTPAHRFFCMIAATAIGGSVRHIVEYARTNGLAADATAQFLAAELLYFACSVARTAQFTRRDLHGLLDEMGDEADEAAGREGAKH